MKGVDTLIKLLVAYPAVMTMQAILWIREEQALPPRLPDRHIPPDQAGAGGGVLARLARTRSRECAGRPVRRLQLHCIFHRRSDSRLPR